MLHCEDDCVNDSLEHLSLQLEHALSTMIDDVVHQFEEGLSELWVADEIVGYHFKSWLTEARQDISEET